MIFYPQGIGGTAAEVALARPLYLLMPDANVIYVDSVSGLNGALPAGRARSRPVATLAQALTNSSNGGIIVLLSTHNETISTTASVAVQNLTIVGEGVDSNGLPSACLTVADAVTTRGVYINVSNVLIQNVRFKAATAALTKFVVQVNDAGCELEDCYFEGGQYNDSAMINFAPSLADGLWFKRCTFVSTSAGTTLATAPREALNVAVVAGNMTLRLDDCVFDGGVTGFRDSAGKPYATSFDASTGTVRVQAMGTSLLRGACFQAVDPSSAWGWFNEGTSTGGGVLILEASAGGGAAV